MRDLVTTLLDTLALLAISAGVAGGMWALIGPWALTLAGGVTLAGSWLAARSDDA